MTTKTPTYAAMLDEAIAITRENLATLTSFPELAHPGRWACVDNGGWVGGHWVGLLWLAYLQTGDHTFEAAARGWASRLVPRQNDTTTHDLGFLFELSHLLGVTLTGDVTLKAPVLTASKTMTLRFNERGKYFQAWRGLDAAPEWRGRAIIDTLMNLDMMFWASKETGDPIYARMAADHARTALARQVRADWSTSHTMDFNPDTGEFLRQDTHQGMSATSCWCRGHAWAVYGYAETFRNTGDATFLDASRNLAAYALRRLPPDHVPFWDFDSPLIPNDVRDSSAGSILAAGLLKLAAYETDAAQAKRWREAALPIVQSLWDSYSNRGTDYPSILIHATRSKPAGHMDSGLIYGDYYFVEALTHLVKPETLGTL
jgi:unsaturated chondroitin disaccharide hydrolase